MTEKQMLAFLEGTVFTVQLTLLAIAFGMVLGLLIALARISRNKTLNSLSWVYVWMFRGTPLLLQILVIYMALPTIGIELKQFPSAIIALSLNSAAYLAEIIRAAIQSIDKGQMEAGKALGMSYSQTMFKIIIPQSYRRMIPPIGNEVIMLLKDSSLVSVIGMTELLRTARLMASGGDIEYYAYAGLIYLFLTSIFTLIFQKLEKKYSIYE